MNRLLSTIGDIILMEGKPWFSHEVGKDFRKRENGGEEYYDMGVWETQVYQMERCTSEMVL